MLHNRFPILLILLVLLLCIAGVFPRLSANAEAASNANAAPGGRLTPSVMMNSLANTAPLEAANMPALQAEFALTVSADHSVPQGKIKVVVTGLHVTDLYGYELRLRFDADKLKFQGATSAIPGFAVNPIVKGDQVTFAHTRTGGGKGDNGEVALCELTFTAIDNAGTPGSVGTAGSAVTGRNAVVELTHVKLVDSQVRMTEQDVDAQATITPNGGTAALRDIAGHWAEAAIRQAVELGIVSGYADGMFRPANPVTRAEFSAMLIRALRLPPGDAAKLDFIDKKLIPAWAGPLVAAGVTSGIVSGYEDHTFRPGSLVSRAEMAALVVKALGLQTTAGANTTFADNGDIPAWAQAYVAEAAKTGLIKGSGGNRFLPNAHATRAEAVTMMMALLKKGEIR